MNITIIISPKMRHAWEINAVSIIWAELCLTDSYLFRHYAYFPVIVVLPRELTDSKVGLEGSGVGVRTQEALE